MPPFNMTFFNIYEQGLPPEFFVWLGRMRDLGDSGSDEDLVKLWREEHPDEA